MSSTDPHQGGDLFDMAKDGTTMPNDAGKQNLIPSVPRPDQISDSSNDPGAPDLQRAADNPTDISRVVFPPPLFHAPSLTDHSFFRPQSNRDIASTGEVLTGTGDALPAQVESKRLHMSANNPLAKGHDRYDKHTVQKESDLERYAGEGAGMEEVPGEEGLEGKREERERKEV